MCGDTSSRFSFDFRKISSAGLRTCMHSQGWRIGKRRFGQMQDTLHPHSRRNLLGEGDDRIPRARS